MTVFHILHLKLASVAAFGCALSEPSWSLRFVSATAVAFVNDHHGHDDDDGGANGSDGDDGF
jgi:hypothetical protein